MIDDSQSENIRLAGSLAKLGVNIKQLEKEMAENEAARKEATAIREKENVEYHEKTREAEGCIQALRFQQFLSQAASNQHQVLQVSQQDGCFRSGNRRSFS